MAFLTRELTVAAMLAVFCATPVWAQQSAAPAKTPTPQQQRMADCNKSASGKKGDERKAYMSSCLKGETQAAKSTPQQRMKDCNAQASAQSLTGDKRKAYMKTCLSNKS